MADLDSHIDGLDSHLTKLRNRLDSAYVSIEIKEYCNCLATYSQLILRLIAMCERKPDADTGAAVRKYAEAFQNAASRGTADSGPDTDLAALKRQLADAIKSGDADHDGGESGPGVRDAGSVARGRNGSD